MSKQSEEARAAAKKKVERITRVDPKAKIDASGYTPPDELMPDVKTGMRPISQRQFKKGGKIHGERAKHHAGRKARASGGALDEDYKKDNAKRAGEKHKGGFKHGGKTKHRDSGGELPSAALADPRMGRAQNVRDLPTKWTNDQAENYQNGYVGPQVNDSDFKLNDSDFKRGGKAKHRDAGGQMQMAYPSVPSSGIYGSSTTAPTKAGMLASASGLKRGGKAKRAPGNSDITGTRPTGGRLAKAEGGMLRAYAGNKLRTEIHKSKDDVQPYTVKHFVEGKHVPEHDMGYASLKEAKTMAEHGSKMPPTESIHYSDRTQRADGGATKSKKGAVNINIIVAGKKDEPPHPPMLPPGMMPPGGPPGAPGAAAKPPMPSPGGAPPMAGPAPGGAPPGMPPMGPH